jgi:hypothetical protein
MAAQKPKYITVEQNFHARPETGKPDIEIVVPTKLKTGLYRRVTASADGILQFATVLEGLELAKALQDYDTLDLEEAAEVSEKYFAALSDAVGAQPGK